MPTFDNLLSALADSTSSLCKKAAECDFNGEGWAPAITLGHIVDVDTEVWIARFELMVQASQTGQKPPQLAWWEPDDEKTTEKYATSSVDDSIALLRKSRNELSNFLKSLSVADRSASALHETFGTITIESMLGEILNHDEEHCANLS